MKTLHLSKILIAISASTIVITMTFFTDYFIPIKEPDATIAATSYLTWPNDTRLTVSNMSKQTPIFGIVIQNFSSADSQGNFIPNQEPQVTIVKKGVPTTIDAVIVPYQTGENGTVNISLAFTYCAPLYTHSGLERPCLEKNMVVFLPQHVVSINQHFNLTITVPDNVPNGLYQLGLDASALVYPHDSDKPSNSGNTQPFWIRVV